MRNKEMTEISGRDLKFIEEYIVSRNPVEAAINAGYAKTTANTKAYQWVTTSKAPHNKQPVAAEIERRLALSMERAQMNADEIHTKLSLLANFNIKKFIKVQDDGSAVYDFTDATDDDWYCIDEFAVEIAQKGSGENVYDVEKVKIKPVAKIAALTTLGKHANVKAFAEELNVTVVDKSDVIRKARERAGKKHE